MKGNIWAQVLARLETSIRRHEFVQWLGQTSFAADDGTTIEVRVPEKAFADWNTKHYGAAIQEALTALGRPGANVSFVVGPPVAEGKPTAGKRLQGKALTWETIEPWHEPVDGATLLETIVEAFERFVTLPEHGATALALWVTFTYTQDAAYVSPILAITSPMKQCGKSTVLSVLSSIVYRRQVASNLTQGVLFRFIDRYAPTLLIDEADTFLPGNDALRGILNSGHTRTTARLIRNIGDDYEPREFTTWCPKAIALIGRLPGTLEDRSIQLQMRRQRRGEQRYRRERCPREDRLDTQALATAAPAHSMGERQPRRAAPARRTGSAGIAQRQDGGQLAAADDDRRGLRRGLASPGARRGGRVERRDVQAGSGAGRGAAQGPATGLLTPQQNGRRRSRCSQADGHGIVPTAEIVKALSELPDRPWGTWKSDKPLTPYMLSRLLRPLRIFPASILRVGDQAIRGYRREAFEDAFSRYLPIRLIGCYDANVSGPKSQFQVDREGGLPINLKSEKTPDFIGSVATDQPDRGKRGVVPLIPALRKSVARAQLRSVSPSRASSATRKGR
jgi:hypothetical protein